MSMMLIWIPSSIEIFQDYDSSLLQKLLMEAFVIPTSNFVGYIQNLWSAQNMVYLNL